MKRLFLILITIITTNISAQDRETELKVYIPLRTYHYDRTPDYKYHSTEGGNIGAIGIYRRTNGRWFNDIQAGAIRNSYDNLAIVGQFGIGKHIGKLDVSMNLGLISGYKNLFEDEIITKTNIITYKGIDYEYEITKTIENENSYRHIMPDWMKDNGILPAVSMSITYNTGRVSPLLVISPEYLNAGVVVSF